MTVKIKQINFLAGMDSDSPDYEVDPRYVREMINFEPILPASGCKTVEGYQRYAGGPLATDQVFHTIWFEAGEYAFQKGDKVRSPDGSKVGQVLVDTVQTDGDYTDGSAKGYFAIFNEGDSNFEVGDELEVRGNIVGVVVDSQENTYPDGSEYIVNIFRELWRYYAETYIPAVPGSGPIRGLFILKGKLYALRDDETEQFLHCYVEQPNNSWKKVPYFELHPGGKLHFKIYNFGDGEKLYGVTGNTQPFIFDDKELIAIDVPVPLGQYPKLVEVYNNQLFLYYDDIEDTGSLLYSAVGDPLDFETTSLGAGEIKVSFHVTHIEKIIENQLAVFGDNIYILDTDQNGNFIFKEFASNSEVVEGTVQRLNGILFTTKSSIYLMSTTNKYGNFELNSLVRRNNLLVADIIREHEINFSYIVPHKNQYRLVCENHILVLTFVNQELVLFSRQVVPHEFNCISNQVNEYKNMRLYYGGTDGFVYKADSGYTFDNEDISGVIITPIISVAGNPQIKCRLRKFVLPSDLGTSITLVGVSYNSIDWRRWGEEYYTEISKMALETGRYNLSFFDTFYWAVDNMRPLDSVMEMYLKGTTPTLVIILFNKNKGIVPAKLTKGYVHYTPRARLR